MENSVVENNWLWSKKLQGLLLVLLIFTVYIPAIKAGYVWDDVMVYESPVLRSGSGLVKIWTDSSAVPLDGRYWPLVYTSFWTEYHLFGNAPMGYHIDNILLHVLNTFLLWWILSELALGIAYRLSAAWLAAAIFAVHPVHVEAVAWVMERKGVLSTAFYLGSLGTFLKFYEKKNWFLYFCSILLFLMALLSKPVTVVLPGVILIWAWWKYREKWKRILLYLLPFIGGACIIGELTVWLGQRRQVLLFELSFLQRFLIASRSVCFYAWKLVWPVPLMTIYPQIFPTTWTAWLFPLFIVCVLMILYLAKNKIGKGPLVAVLFFIVSLIPILGFVNYSFMAYSFVADRYQYVPSIGLIALFSVGVVKILDARYLKLVVTGLLLVLGTLTWQQAKTYQNMETLFRYNLEVNPQAWAAHSNLAVALGDRGEYAEAVEHITKVIQHNPRDAGAYFNLGHMLEEEDKLTEAQDALLKSISLEPQGVQARDALAIVKFKQGKLEEAYSCLNQAFQIQPDFAEGHNTLGVIFGQQGKWDEAIRQFTIALKIKPDFIQAQNNLQRCLAHKQKQ
jgi:protein O-mannosyl-transferase